MNGRGTNKEKEAEPLVVITTIASFSDRDKKITRMVRPERIMRRSGQVHRIEEVTSWHEEFTGHGHRQIHVTVKTKEDLRVLDVVFDTRKMGWYLVHEEPTACID